MPLLLSGHSESSTATTVVAGNDHSCALRSDGSVVCWGSNSYGQLGIETTIHLGVASGFSLTAVRLGSGVLTVSSG
jgi:alpha-tubulin suppressor-like RCC1 family protein